MSPEDFRHECIAVQHANFQLGYFLELNIKLALEAANVQPQEEYQVLQESANMDLVCNQLITNELN